MHRVKDAIMEKVFFWETSGTLLEGLYRLFLIYMFGRYADTLTPAPLSDSKSFDTICSDSERIRLRPQTCFWFQFRPFKNKII